MDLKALYPMTRFKNSAKTVLPCYTWYISLNTSKYEKWGSSCTKWMSLKACWHEPIIATQLIFAFYLGFLSHATVEGSGPALYPFQRKEFSYVNFC